MSRDLRDILAGCMHRERLGLTRPDWAALASGNDFACEQYRKRADHLIRLLEANGVSIVRNGDVPEKALPSGEIYRCHMHGSESDRAIRQGDNADDWHLVKIDGDSEKIIMTVSQAQWLQLGGRVLMGDVDVLKVQGLATILAVGNEVLCKVAA